VQGPSSNPHAEEQTVTRADLHRLVDQLPASRQEVAFRILKCLRDEKEGNEMDPFLIAMAAAPDDDELFTPEEQVSVQKAEEELARGQGIPAQQVWRELLGDS